MGRVINGVCCVCFGVCEFGRGLIWSLGRQKKELIPAFSNASVREMMGVFYDTAHRVSVPTTSLF